MKSATMRDLVIVGVAMLSMLPLGSNALAQHNFDETKKAWPDLRILAPDKIRTLSAPIKSDLSKRGCRIPMFTKWDGRHNVIRGSFRIAGSSDVAVLCYADDEMSIIVYPDGRVANAEELRKLPANALRMIYVMSPFVLNKRAIRDKAVDKLPKFDHDAIEDGLIGGHAETTYYDKGVWHDVF